METIGDRIRRIREAQGIQRKDLAADAGISYSGLSDLEAGKARSSTKLHRIAALLGVDTAYLETGKTPAKVQESPAPYSLAKSAIDPAIVFDVARALHEAHEELGLKYNFIENPQLFIDAYRRAATFGNFSEGRGSAWLGSHISKAGSQGAPPDEQPTRTHAKSVHKRTAGGSPRKT
jgi:transcriptional regulator with XRE-family HTH domain